MFGPMNVTRAILPMRRMLQRSRKSPRIVFSFGCALNWFITALSRRPRRARGSDQAGVSRPQRSKRAVLKVPTELCGVASENVSAPG